MALLQSDLDFAFWLGGRRPSRVLRERTPVRVSEVRRRRYDAETERLRSEVRIRGAVDRWRAGR